jgi:two-component system, cell cycle sensor histidine kinase and response regulator CckA
VDDHAKSREELLEELKALRARVSPPARGEGKMPQPQPPAWVARIPETIAESLFVLDLDWRFVYLNDQAVRDTRQTADDLLGHSLWEKFPALLGTPLEGHYRRAMAEQTPVHFEMRALLSSRWLEVHAFPAPEGLVAYSRDASDRRRLEDQLRQVQKMEAVGQLAGGVAHDFNNKLTVIEGYAHLLLEQLDPAGSAEGMAREILKAAERAAELTKQLLAFGRKTMTAPRFLDLNAIITGVEHLLRRVVGEDVELTVDLGKGARPLHADPDQLQQLIMNLALNARDAMPRGGRLTLRTADVQWDVDSAPAAPGACPMYILLEVADTGCGMTEEVRSRIFEPFFTTKASGKGVGLGLAVVYGIVTQVGGHITVRSAPGQGCTFQIYLPRAEEVPAAETPLNDVGVVGDEPSEGKTVLLVEDEDGVRAIARRVLERQGYVVLEAANGDAALAMARGHTGRIDLLVTDVVMPVLGGSELAKRLTPLWPGMKVLFVSGYTDDAVVRAGIQQDEVNFLEKPFTPVALAQRVRDILGQ